MKLEHSSTELIQMIQKATALGNWWLAASSQQCTRSCMHLMQSFLAKHEITQVAQPPYSPDLAPCNFKLFPKLKSTLKGKRFQTIDEIQENRMGQLMVIWRTVLGPKVPPLKGIKASLSYVQCFLCRVFFSKCLCFSYYMAGYLLDRPHRFIPEANMSVSFSMFQVMEPNQKKKERERQRERERERFVTPAPLSVSQQKSPFPWSGRFDKLKGHWKVSPLILGLKIDPL